jgi:hypothetical protein
MPDTLPVPGRSQVSQFTADRLRRFQSLLSRINFSSG